MNPPTTIFVGGFFNRTTKGEDTMKNILFLLAIVIATLPTNSHAKFRAGDNNRCWIDDHKRNEFWYCGSQDTKCAGYKLKSSHHRHWLYHGDNFTNDNRKFWCCNGTTSAQGIFVEAASFYKEDTVVTKDLGTGTCNWHKRVDVCDNVIGTECTTPDECNSGYILRNKECVEPCQGDTAFESEVSNTCIECKTTNYQGINKDRICQRCNSATEFWDKRAEKCIKKDTLTKMTSQAMKKCYGCTQDLFKQCALIFSKPESERLKDPNKDLLKDCHLNSFYDDNREI